MHSNHTKILHKVKLSLLWLILPKLIDIFSKVILNTNLASTAHFE